MDMFSEARAFLEIIEARKITQATLAKTLGVSQSYVANKIRLLSHSEAVREKILEYSICERKARALLVLTRDEDKLCIIDKIVKMKLNTAETEVLINEANQKRKRERLKTCKGREAVALFYELLNEAVISLKVNKIKVQKTESEEGGKRYITIEINEKL